MWWHIVFLMLLITYVKVTRHIFYVIGNTSKNPLFSFFPATSRSCAHSYLSASTGLSLDACMAGITPDRAPIVNEKNREPATSTQLKDAFSMPCINA